MCTKNKAVKDSAYSRFFARIYNPIMNTMERKILRVKRKELFSGISGNVLEVGAGTGINFDLYNPENTTVYAFEPSESMLSYAKEKLQKMEYSEHIRLIQAGVGDDMPIDFIPKEGFDYVVFTLVLCTIPDVVSALEVVKSHLKKDAKILVLEHIKAKGFFGKFIQNLLNPIWKYCAEGCHLNRSTDLLLKEMGFRVEKESYFTKLLPFYTASLKLDSING